MKAKVFIDTLSPFVASWARTCLHASRCPMFSLQLGASCDACKMLAGESLTAANAAFQELVGRDMTAAEIQEFFPALGEIVEDAPFEEPTARIPS